MHDAALGFWVINNHWDVNFSASQSGTIPFRFHILPMDGPDRAAATAFAQAAATPPVIVRTYDAPERAAAPLVSLTSNVPLDLRMRPFGEGAIMVSVANRSPTAAAFTLTLAGQVPQSVVASAATGEVIDGDVHLEGGSITGRVTGRGVLRLRIGV
jgi:hypothetical protein